MKVQIMPSKVSGTISAPASKSYTHRAIIIASLADGTSVIRSPLISEDTVATIEACRKLGAKITIEKKYLIITGMSGYFPKRKFPLNIFCGLSGTTMRFITGIAALSASEVFIDGHKRLRKRPIKDLLTALQSLGIEAEAIRKKNLLPLRIKGGSIKGGKITVSGEISSQFVSALLLISPFAKKDTTIIIDNLHSKPYVDVTIDLMKAFGVEVKQDRKSYFVKSGQRFLGKEYTIEGDYSSASYFFAAAAITDSKITLKNLNPYSAQGDKYFLDILKKMGCRVIKNKNAVTVMGNKLHGVDADLGNYPDIVPTLAVVAANASGKTLIANIAHLRMKESDRIQAIETELRKMSIQVESKVDFLQVQGRALSTKKRVMINTYNDHRIAMSFAIAGLVAEGETVINNAEVVNKSYPDFWKDLQKIGANIKII